MVRHGGRTWIGPVGAVVVALTAVSPAAADTPRITGEAVATAVATPTVAACPTWSSPVRTGSTSATLPELSGLAPALAPGRWWTHNDSGDAPRLFLVDEQLSILAEVRLSVAFAFDVEDIATAPDGRIWVADIGDNLRIRPGTVLWGIDQRTTSATVAPTVLNLVYPDGAQDAESLMIDPLSGDGFIVSKAIIAGRSSVYRIPASVFAAPPAGAFPLELVGSIDVSDGGSIGPTAADISPSGRYIAVKTFTTTYLWPRVRGDSVVATLAAQPHAPCRVEEAGTNEAFAFSLDGRHLATVAEGVGSSLGTQTRTS